MVSAAKQNTAIKYSKTGRANPKSISQEATYHGILTRTPSRYQASEKLLWKVSIEASQMSSWNQMSLTNISRSSDSFNTVLPIVNGSDWGCNVHDLETIIVLEILVFNFISQMSHHSLTLLRVWFRDCSAAITLTPGDCTTNKIVESSALRTQPITNSS